MFLKRFFPMYYYINVESIPYQIFEKENIKAVIFDLDNTLVDSKYKYDEKVKKWINDMRQKNIKFCILSNTPRKNKVKKIAQDFDMPYILNASKPRHKGFNQAIELLKAEKENTVIIGDQVFTDIWGGNRFGIKTILVSPIAKKELIFTRIKRPLERYIIRKYNKNKKEGR